MNARKGRKFPPEPLTVEEIRQMIEACGRKSRSKSAVATRNRALITVLYRGGLRIGEALALLPKDVQDGTVRILHGKGDKSRVVGLDPGALAILECWVARRKMLAGVNGHDPLFCTLEGGPIDRHYVGQLLRRLAAKAGITKRVHAHGLRHSYSVSLVEEGVPMHVVQAALGHSNIGTTNTYVSHLKPAQVIAATQNRRFSLEPDDPNRAELLRLRAEIDRALAG